MSETRRTVKEEFKVSGEQLLGKVKELIHEGNVRHIRVKQEGKVVLELPISVVAIGLLVAPVLAALGAVAAIATDCTLEVEREAGPGESEEK